MTEKLLTDDADDLLTDDQQRRFGAIRKELEAAGVIMLVWDINDVREACPDLTAEEAKAVLLAVADGHDANAGVTWGTIEEEAARLPGKKAE